MRQSKSVTATDLESLRGKTIVVGGDHHCRDQVEGLVRFLRERHVSTDVIPYDRAREDYISQAQAVAERVSTDPKGCAGIIGCSNGFGVTLVANKYPLVFAVRCASTKDATVARQKNYSNVITFGSSLSREELSEMVWTWIETRCPWTDRDRERLNRLVHLAR